VTPDQRIARLASRGHGVFHRSDARDAGLSTRQIAHRVAVGRWEQVRPGVFRISGLPTSAEVVLAAAVLATGGTASHLSATALHRLTEHHPPTPEVTTSVGAGHHHRDVRLHRTSDLLPRDVQHITGIRCTNAVRTLIDLGARLPADDLHLILDRALHRGVVHLDPLTSRFLQLARPGRDGVQVVRTVLVRMDPTLAPAESDLESLLWRLLASANLPLPQRQVPVEIDGHRYRLDAAYPELQLAIECDGFVHHGTRRAFESDRERQNRLVTAGWTVLRFTWQQVVRRPDDVVSTIGAALSRCAR
jgi:very-short-patch-repair endonuclease